MSLYKKQSRLLLISFVLFVFLAACSEEKDTPAPVISSFTPLQGEVGASVTVSGEHFGNSPIVFVNETQATITGTPSANQIQFTVPAGASTGKIKVVAGGVSGISATNFVVLNVPVIE